MTRKTIKIGKTICTGMTAVGIFVILGTAGAADAGVLSIGEIILQSAGGVLLATIGLLLLSGFPIE